MSSEESTDSSRTILWSKRAQDDLTAIGDYIARDNPRAALSWVNKLIEDIERAAMMPLAGRAVPEFAERKDIREVLRRSHRIVYQVMSDSIIVLTIFESHRLFPEDAIGGPDDESPRPH